ncbi:hypothetical protein V2G26_010094 [Clonostachys chloroleuca]
MERRTSVARSQPDSSGLQAILDPTLEVTPGDGMIPVSSGGLAKPEGQFQSATLVPTDENISEAQKKPRRRRYYIIGAVVAVLIILGAVLGGVLGSRKAVRRDAPSTTLDEDVRGGLPFAFSSWHDSKGPHYSGFQPQWEWESFVAFYLNTTNFVNAIDYGRSFIRDSINDKDYQAMGGAV